MLAEHTKADLIADLVTIVSRFTDWQNATILCEIPTELIIAALEAQQDVGATQ